MTEITKLIDRWNSDEGKPYKGSLIDRDSYSEGDLSCMCAQGQVLHVVGGWDADRLSNTEQAEADRETAKLLNISRAHAVLLRNINDKADGAPAVVLTDPGKVLSEQWSKLLDFWWHMDTLGAYEWEKVAAAWVAARVAAGEAARAAAWVAARDAAKAAAGDAAWDAAWAAAWDAAKAAAGDAAWDAARVAAWDAAGDAAGDAAWAAAWAAARDAAVEIQGAEIFKRDGTPFFFLPVFGFASPDDIPARPADYGVYGHG
jgi:hypothetical protein